MSKKAMQMFKQRQMFMNSKNKLRKELVSDIEKSSILKTCIAIQGAYLLTLKKEGWWQKRALRLLQDTNQVIDDLLDGYISAEDIINQVEIEFGINLLLNKDVSPMKR